MAKSPRLKKTKLIDEASLAIRHELGELKLIKAKEQVSSPGTYDVFDQYHNDGPCIIFSGPKSECEAFLKGIMWGAKAGRSAMAAQF